MTLSPENKSLLERHRNPPAGDAAITIRPADLNRLLDAARAEGYEKGRAGGERSEHDFPRSGSWT